jgi:tetratricopeptide (TPR) repeat protein
MTPRAISLLEAVSESTGKDAVPPLLASKQLSIIYQDKVSDFLIKTVKVYNFLADFYHYFGNYDMALNYYGKILTIQEELFGKEHPDTVETSNKIAEIKKNG